MNGEEARMVALATKTAVPRADQDQEQANFVGQVQRLIQALLGDAALLALVAKRKVTPETLTAGLALITTFNDKRALEDTGFEIAGYESQLSAFSSARASFLRAEIDAKSATAARDEAFKALKAWAASLHRALRLALKTRPDLLATLGL